MISPTHSNGWICPPVVLLHIVKFWALLSLTNALNIPIFFQTHLRTAHGCCLALVPTTQAEPASSSSLPLNSERRSRVATWLPVSIMPFFGVTAVTIQAPFNWKTEFLQFDIWGKIGWKVVVSATPRQCSLTSKWLDSKALGGNAQRPPMSLMQQSSLP